MRSTHQPLERFISEALPGSIVAGGAHSLPIFVLILNRMLLTSSGEPVLSLFIGPTSLNDIRGLATTSIIHRGWNS